MELYSQGSSFIYFPSDLRQRQCKEEMMLTLAIGIGDRRLPHKSVIDEQ